MINEDLPEPGEVKKPVSEIIVKYGRIDVLVDNAGVFEEFDIMSLSYKEWQQVWNKTIARSC